MLHMWTPESPTSLSLGHKTDQFFNFAANSYCNSIEFYLESETQEWLWDFRKTNCPPYSPVFHEPNYPYQISKQGWRRGEYQGLSGATQGSLVATPRTPHLKTESLHFYTSGFRMRFLSESWESQLQANRTSWWLTHGSCVWLRQAMLAGQSHLGGRRIGPIALKEAAKRDSKAQHNDLEVRREHRGLLTPEHTFRDKPPGNPGRRKHPPPLSPPSEDSSYPRHVPVMTRREKPWDKMLGVSGFIHS